MTDSNDSSPIMWRVQHAADRVVRQLAATVAGAVDALEVQHRRRVLERQLDALDDRAISDIGIARDQIPAVASAYPGAPQLLRRPSWQRGQRGWRRPAPRPWQLLKGWKGWAKGSARWARSRRGSWAVPSARVWPVRPQQPPTSRQVDR